MWLTLSPGGVSSCDAWIEYAIKHNIAPIHSSKEKPVNICLQNFTHSGVVGGGVRAFGPSLSRIRLASSKLKPYKYKCTGTHTWHILLGMSIQMWNWTDKEYSTTFVIKFKMTITI